ncbi:hypothetical protein L3Q67_45130 (plasmid) [Saccharothrix sp. AJ9571]|nr:hypothetical protein L3Q67_45130 [Saccharothrix sp. AJ9571]
MTVRIAPGGGLAEFQHDLVATAQEKQLLLRCHTIAFNSGVNPSATGDRIAQLDRELTQLWDQIANVQLALRAS